MSRHPSEEMLLDLAEGRAAEPWRTHLAECPACSARVSEAAQALAVARRADVPEPPEPYWSGFGHAVRRRIDESSSRRPRWSWLVPLGAAAAATAVIAFVPRQPAPLPAPPPAASLPSWSALPPIEEDAAVPMLEAAASDAEPGLLALDEGRGLGSFVAALTDDEAQALAEALRAQRKDGAL